MELLRELSACELPVEVTSQGDVDKLRVLCAAGLVAAFLPPATVPLDRPQRPATVLAITGRGWEALRGKLVVA